MDDQTILNEVLTYLTSDLILNIVKDLILAILVLVIGWKSINLLQRFLRKGLKKAHADDTLRPFLLSLSKYTLRILLIVSVISILGVPTTSLIAALGAAGLAIGLALQGTLSNFAGGVVILLFKPYKIDDFVEAGGFTGKIKSVQLFHTIMVTFEGNRVIIPNGEISNQGIINYTAEAVKKIDIHMRISYDNDIEKARNIALKLMQEDERILEDPAPKVVVGDLTVSSVTLFIRCNVTNSDMWNVKFKLLEDLKKEFDKTGIKVPGSGQVTTVVNDSNN